MQRHHISPKPVGFQIQFSADSSQRRTIKIGGRYTIKAAPRPRAKYGISERIGSRVVFYAFF
ncbi:MAG: hypothetical protein ACJAVO_000447 [Parvibaculaceae bacterium]|jgi:hypothetical protein